MSQMDSDKKRLITFGGLAGVIASLCCIGPVVLVLFGLGGISLALSIGRFSWFFTAIAIIFFVIGTMLYLKKRNACTVNGVRKHAKILLLSFAVLIVVLIILKYLLAPLLAGFVYR